MTNLTPRAEEFIRAAATEDILSILQHFVSVDTGGTESVDLAHEEGGHRHVVFQITPQLYLGVDIEKDVIVSVFRSTMEQVRDDVLAHFAGYSIGTRSGNFDIGIRNGTVPSPENGVESDGDVGVT